MQVVDLSTGSRRDDVTASVGDMHVCKSGRFVAVIDYDRQHSVAVHCLDGLLGQLTEEGVAAGAQQRCPDYARVEKETPPSPQSTAQDDCAALRGVTPQPESELTAVEFDQRCRRSPPRPVGSGVL